MPYIKPRGNRNARIWCILAKPYSSDYDPKTGKDTLMSGGLGHVFDKMLREAGIDPYSVYFTSRAPNTDDLHAYTNLESELSASKPPLIIVIGDVAGWFLSELRTPKTVETNPGQLQKYAGSLLQCGVLQYPHYMMPLYGPDRCVGDWKERNVTVYVDLQKLQDELVYWQKHGTLRPLPERTMRYGNLELNEILSCFERFRKAPLLSIDIETVYPRKGSAFLPHPGYPITVGIADSHDFGISFNLFRDSPSENRTLWRALDLLLKGKPILGQNFFNFDALFFEALGFQISLDRVQDTLLRHHILWPELSHKLQFLTRQYTREPYYKDEGHGWSVKHMDKLRRYNCLDVCVTYEVWEQQELEFQQRPQLK
jgi:uracil-DNA glycosylase